MKTSILIHNRDRAADLKRCLASIAAIRARPLELVLVDGGSTDASASVIEEASPLLREAGIEVRIEGSETVGVAASRNALASLATGSLLLFLDNDAAMVADGGLEDVIRRFEHEPDLAVVSGAVLDGDTEELDQGAWVYRRPSVTWRGRRFESFTFSGCGSCIRTSAFEQAGGFWGALPYSREEEDLALGLLDRGWKIDHDPRFKVRHYSSSVWRVDAATRRNLELRNGVMVLYRRLPLPFALAAIVARATTMSIRARRVGQSLPALWQGLPDARLLWKRSASRRTPIRLRTLARYVTLHKPGSYRSVETSAPRRTTSPSRVDVLGMGFDAVSAEQAVGCIRSALRSGRHMQIVPGNVDFVMKARRDETFREELANADLVVADGVPVVWAASMLGTPLRSRVSGTALVQACATVSAELDSPVALVGAAPGVADRAAAVMSAEAPGSRLHAVPTPFPLDEDGTQKVVAAVRESGAGIVLAALGAPLQERWVAQNLEATGASVGIGVGSAFDIISGDKPRAPGWMRDSGLEWLHRLVQDPKRLARRYLIENSPFILHLAGAVLTRRLGRGPRGQRR